MNRACKYQSYGCQFVGVGTAVREHLNTCAFREKLTEEKKIPCKQLIWSGCDRELSLAEIVDHLKIDERGHKGFARADEFGKFYTSFRRTAPHNDKWNTWKPEIIAFKNQHFIFQAQVWNYVWIFWVTLVGSKEEAQKYEVKMSIPKKAGQHFTMSFQGKVFSVEDCVKDLANDRTNVLRLENSLAQVNEYGKPRIAIDYQIICKKKVKSN